MADLIQYYGTGRRKSSIARVFLRPGSGKFTVNGKDSETYFVTAQQRAAAKRSLGIAGIEETFDVITTVKGMLPKSKLGRQMATKLKVYKGEKHPHLAQQPVAMDFHASNAPKVLTSKVMVPMHPHQEHQKLEG